MLKASIEDVAFELWNCNDDVTAQEFAVKFLDDYPGFCGIWEVEALGMALEERL